MATAGGPKVQIPGGYLAVSAYSRVYAQVQPILGGPNPGRYDSNGNYLHFLYQGNLPPGPSSSLVTQAPDFMPLTIEVEFDAQSQFTLPFDGNLKLVGGLGEWKFKMWVQEVIDPQFYNPRLRTLQSYVQNVGLAPVDFTIPDNHTFCLGVQLATVFTLPGGVPFTPSTNLPGLNVIPGTVLGVNATTWILTGWDG